MIRNVAILTLLTHVTGVCAICLHVFDMCMSAETLDFPVRAAGTCIEVLATYIFLKC